MPASSPYLTVVGRLRPVSAGPSVLRSIGFVLLGTALLALAAHVQVPFWPVKLSMQTFVVMMIGVACGSRLAGATLTAYLAEGALGLPVFQSGAGLAYMAGPTAGYLLGYVCAAVLTGMAAERGLLTRTATALAVVVAALAAIYVPGVAWLAALYGPAKGLQFGLLPFIPGETLKMALVLALIPIVRPVRR